MTSGSEESIEPTPGMMEIAKGNFATAHSTTDSIKKRAPVIYQTALKDGAFAGYADFLILDAVGSWGCV